MLMLNALLCCSVHKGSDERNHGVLVLDLNPDEVALWGRGGKEGILPLKCLQRSHCLFLVEEQLQEDQGAFGCHSTS